MLSISISSLQLTRHSLKYVTIIMSLGVWSIWEVILLHINRRDTINEYIKDKGEVRLTDLEGMFPEVSSMTIRRDLIYLENHGHILRIRGGARAISQSSNSIEGIYSQRANVNMEAKISIAKKAVAYVETGRSVYIDPGTTMMSLAKILPNEELSILTSSPNIGLEIAKHSKPSITFIGGQLNRNNLCTSGIYALDFIKNINIDIAFIAASGFSLDSGFTCGNLNECELKKAVVKKARHRIMLMDSSKLDKTMPYTFARLEEIDILICEKALPTNIQEVARDLSVTLI